MRLRKLKIKMLREVDGSIEEFYATPEEKKLLDAERKMSRRINTMEIREQTKKKDLQKRQKVARELRGIKQKLNTFEMRES